MSSHVLAIDAGTTGITLLLFNKVGEVVRKVHAEFRQHYPKPGWVEHDAEEIWEVTKRLIDEIMGDDPRDSVTAIGITNQRETTVIWDKTTGKPYGRAIVWQCRRTADRCRELASSEGVFRDRTGLVLDAYFSGTKASWILEHNEAAAAGARAGNARFGTIDTWLIDRLSGGRLHVTDPTNACRTLMYDIHEKAWSDDLLGLLGVPRSMLPEVKPSSAVYGTTDASVFGAEVPIAGAVGDQQAATFGQLCVKPGDSKNTYGTGCFTVVIAGHEKVEPRTGLLLTLACDETGAPVYAHEGSIFVAGAVVQWLRDEMKMIDRAEETDALARSVPDTAGVHLVPAFAGLGAPYWDPDARGAVLGLTRGAGRAHIVRAALESIAYQTRDLMEALGGAKAALRVDGGAAANDFLMQFQADLLGVNVLRPSNLETTAQGAAYLAGLATGYWSGFDEIREFRKIDRIFEPKLDQTARDDLYKHWQAAVRRVRTN